MKYDKKSFCAGISVGTQLKGWAGGSGLGGGGKLSDITVRSGATDYVEKPAEGFYGIGSVTVVGDEHLVPGNIKSGVEILGVTGSYAPAPLKLASVSRKITANGSYPITPGSGYDGLSKVSLTVDVPVTRVEEVVDAKFQSKTVTPRAATQTVTPDTDSGYNALSSVTVTGDSYLTAGNIRKGATIFGVKGTYEKTEKIDAVFQDRTVTPGRDRQTITPNNGANAIRSVTVLGDGELIASNIREGVEIFGVKGSYSTGQKYQAKTVTPTGREFVVTSDSDYNALARVTVAGDKNLTPSKIAKGATIYGVTGTYVSPLSKVTVVPSMDEQLVLPPTGFDGFSSVTVAPVGDLGEYGDGYAAGAASRDAEVASLQEQIAALTTERDAAYESGYNAGFDEGYDEGAANADNKYTNWDGVKF